MKDDDNWLINVQIYSEEFRADLNSIWMDEMGLPATPIIRNQVKHYRIFFRAKDRRDTVKKLSGSISTAPQMHLAVMAALAGCNDIQPNKIIKAVIHAGLDLDTNSIYQSFLTYGADKPFWVMVSQATGYSEGDDSNLGRLAIHMLLTAATRTMHQDHLAGLDAFISTPHQAYCYDFVSDWLHSEDGMQLYEVARYVEDEARLPQRFSKLAVEDLVDTEARPPLRSAARWSGMIAYPAIMTVSFKSPICKLSSWSTLPDSTTLSRIASGKSTLRITTGWIPITGYSISASRRV